jgi:hypothetical protein
MSLTLDQSKMKRAATLEGSQSKADDHKISPEMREIRDKVEIEASLRFPNSADQAAKVKWAQEQFLERATKKSLEPIQEQQKQNLELQAENKRKFDELNGLAIPKTEESKQKQDTVKASIVDTKDLKLAFRKGNSFENHSSTVSLASNGEITVMERDFKGKINDVSKDFKALYLGKDNVLRDQDGNQIKTIQSATGNLTASFVPQMISKREADGKILGIKSDLLNSFTHDGKQIIFVSGTPPVSNGKSNQVETKQQQEKTEDTRQKTKRP